MATISDLTLLADKLTTATDTATPIEPITAQFPGLKLEDAYAIQMEIVQQRVSAGRRIVGKKIGLSGRKMQELLGVSEPDYGHLFDDMILNSGEQVAMTSLIQPRCEAEIAFLLNEDLAGPGVTVADVIAATEGCL